MGRFVGPDRRLRARFRVRVPFVLRGRGQEMRGMTRNVSLLGISAYGDGPSPLAESTECILELSRQPLSTITAHGTVIRSEALPEVHPDGSYEVGVFFKEFEKKSESILSKFLGRVSASEEVAIQKGYLALKQRIAARRRRKLLEQRRKLRLRQERLRRRKRRLAKQKKRSSR